MEQMERIENLALWCLAFDVFEWNSYIPICVTALIENFGVKKCQDSFNRLTLQDQRSYSRLQFSNIEAKAGRLFQI